MACLVPTRVRCIPCWLWVAVLVWGCSKPSSSTSPVSVETSAAQASSATQAFTAIDEWTTRLNAVRAGEVDSLHVMGQVIDDNKLTELASVADTLKTLILDEGAIHDRGLLHLTALHKLEHLRLRYSPITDAGIADLVKNSPVDGLTASLRVLNLPQSELTAVGLQELAACSQLMQLRLGGSQIDDAAVAAIAKLPNLRSLHLIAPSLTGLALEHLADAPKLSSFYLDQCPLDDAAWQKLFDAKPDLHVHIDQGHHDLDPNHHQH